MSVRKDLRAKYSVRSESPMERSGKGSSEAETPLKKRDKAAYRRPGILKCILSMPLFASSLASYSFFFFLRGACCFIFQLFPLDRCLTVISFAAHMHAWTGNTKQHKEVIARGSVYRTESALTLDKLTPSENELCCCRLLQQDSVVEPEGWHRLQQAFSESSRREQPGANFFATISHGTHPHPVVRSWTLWVRISQRIDRRQWA